MFVALVIMTVLLFIAMLGESDSLGEIGLSIAYSSTLIMMVIYRLNTMPRA